LRISFRVEVGSGQMDGTVLGLPQTLGGIRNVHLVGPSR
jgi:hypothetical protein